MANIIRNQHDTPQPHKRIHAFLIIMFTLLLSFNLRGQDSTSGSTKECIDLSGGLGAVQDFAGTVAGEVRIQSGNDLVTFQMLYSKEFNGILWLELPSPREKVFNIGLLYGKTYSFHLRRMLFPFFPFAIIINKEADYSVSASAGIGMTQSLLRGNLIHKGSIEDHSIFAEDRNYTVGFPVQLEIVQNFSSQIGYVHRLYANFNNRRNSWGLLWGLQYYITQ
jgi:hypothetical protein